MNELADEKFDSFGFPIDNFGVLIDSVLVNVFFVTLLKLFFDTDRVLEQDWTVLTDVKLELVCVNHHLIRLGLLRINRH